MQFFQLCLILFLVHLYLLHALPHPLDPNRKGMRDNQKVGTTATLWLLGLSVKFVNTHIIKNLNVAFFNNVPKMGKNEVKVENLPLLTGWDTLCRCLLPGLV